LTIGADRQDFRKKPSPADTKDVAKVNVNTVFPLLKGRGSASAAANETAAEQKSRAAEFRFYHSVSSTLKDAVNAYWEYKATIFKVQTQVESEKRVLKWRETAATAAAKQEGSWQNAKEKYTHEVSYLQGYLADKRRNVTEATRQVNITKGALAIAMGIPAAQLNQIGFPSEDFPKEWQSVLTRLEQHPMQANWKEIALDKRLDLQSSKLQQQSAMTLLIKARQDILPQLNAGLNYNYNSLEWGDGLDRYTFTSDMRGNDTMVNLTFSYPLGNDVAKGQRDLASANYQIQTSQVNNLIRTIYLQIDTATTELMSQLKAVVETKKAVETYLPSLDQLVQAQQNLASDPAAIINLVELEDRLNKAGLDYTDALLGLAKAVIDLRFQTGTLIAPSQTGERELILEDNLNSLPGIQN
jgi:outer membrane protein TolC